jgi:hypothetical protein
VLSIASEVAPAFDVLTVDVDSILGMVAKVGQSSGNVTDGPKAVRFGVLDSSSIAAHSAPPFCASMPAFRILSAAAKIRCALRSGIVAPASQF